MSREISKAEVQLCLTVKNIRKPSFTKDDLLGFGQMAFKDELDDWSAAFDSFCQHNLLCADGDHYSLTPEGEKYAEQIVTRELFGKLYFAKDLTRTIGQLKTLLKPDGQMGLFFSEVVTEIGGSRDQLAADQTKLARALGANGFAFTAYDFTAGNLAFWRRSQEIIVELKPEFEAEGNKDLCEGRIVEGDSVLALAVAGRMSRYLYHARVTK